LNISRVAEVKLGATPATPARAKQLLRRHVHTRLLKLLIITTLGRFLLIILMKKAGGKTLFLARQWQQVESRVNT